MNRSAFLATLVISAAIGLAAGAEAAAAPAPVGLSITLTDGVQQVRSGAEVTYVAKLSNSGPKKVTTRLVLATPAYVTVEKAPNARTAKHQATWKITVAPGKVVTRTATAHIGTIAKGDLRVTSLASVYQGSDTRGTPLIRTADANTIAGVTDPARTIPSKGASPPASSHRSKGPSLLLVVGLPIAGLVLLALAAVCWRRRRPTPGETAGEEHLDDLASVGSGIHDATAR